MNSLATETPSTNRGHKVKYLPGTHSENRIAMALSANEVRPARLIGETTKRYF